MRCEISVRQARGDLQHVVWREMACHKDGECYNIDDCVGNTCAGHDPREFTVGFGLRAWTKTVGQYNVLVTPEFRVMSGTCLRKCKPATC